ncbi:MAG: MBL fold metallo-hydrolase [Clostridiaceae bacterium]|nr:MBL fold metallo-hydrolase [Clostridiaceae bacterium]
MTKMYQLQTRTIQQMMSYVIITRENRCIVIDGGNTGDADYLLEFLKDKTNSEKVNIDAWFFSHVHSDHVNAFVALANSRRDEFCVKKVLFNFPSRELVAEYDYTDSTVLTMDEFYKAVEELDTEVVILQNKDEYFFGDVRFEVLLVNDESFMRNSNVVNNSCSIVRMEVEEQTVLFLGDAGVEQGRTLLDMYGEKLRSDFVQMAHHGQNGVEKEVYEAIKPKACLWPTPLWLYDNDIGNGYGSGPWQTLTVREWMQELGVKHHFIDKDGNHEIVFPFQFD